MASTSTPTPPTYKSLSQLVSMSTLPSTNRLENQTCTICQEDFMAGTHPEFALKLPDCGHVFGVSCISTWIKGGNNSCPMCRKSILDTSTSTTLFNDGNINIPSFVIDFFVEEEEEGYPLGYYNLDDVEDDDFDELNNNPFDDPERRSRSTNNELDVLDGLLEAIDDLCGDMFEDPPPTEEEAGDDDGDEIVRD